MYFMFLKLERILYHLLCKNGLIVVLESENSILTKSEIFVGKGYSCDGMFKLSLILLTLLIFEMLVWHI